MATHEYETVKFSPTNFCYNRSSLTIRRKLNIFTDGFPAPSNVKLRRVSSTALEVAWDSPPLSGIVGYRIYYNMFAVDDMEKWQSMEIGPYKTTEISSLEPHTSYAVCVRAKASDGRYSDFSEIIVSNEPESGKLVAFNAQ